MYMYLGLELQHSIAGNFRMVEMRIFRIVEHHLIYENFLAQ